MDNPVSIYAELLPNIRQVSIAVTLANPPNNSTKFTIRNSAASTSALCVYHANTSKSLILPAAVAIPDGYELPIHPGRPLEWRLPVNPQNSRAQDENEVPWEAKDLVAGGSVSCRNCNATLVPTGRAEVWKDLPAEGWAEMMEFWHCHKPGDDHEHAHGEHVAGGEERAEKDEDRERLASRGYGANSAILAQKGVGFVDLTTFLFHEEDCEGIQLPTSGENETGSAGKATHVASDGGVIDLTSTSEEGDGNEVVNGRQRSLPPPGSLNIFCKSCSTQAGYLNNVKGGVSLFKWAVSVPTTSTIPDPPQLAECISAILSATKARTGSSKAILLPLPGTEPPPSGKGDVQDQPAIYTQILIPAITYASTEQPTCPSPAAGVGGGIPAMKILYRPVEKAEVDKMLEDLHSDVQEANLAWEEIRRLMGEDGLPRSTKILPIGQREFMKCKVGLLRRWTSSG